MEHRFAKVSEEEIVAINETAFFIHLWNLYETISCIAKWLLNS